MAVAMIPMFVAAAVVPSTVIVALYGRAWAGSVPLFVPLALAMPLYALLCVGGPLLWGIGKVERELRVEIATGVLAIAVFAVTSRISVVCLAWGVLGIYAFRFLGLTREMVLNLQVTWKDVGLALRGSVVVGLMTAVVVWCCDGMLARTGLSVLIRLVADIAVGLCMTCSPLLMAPNVVIGPSAPAVLAQIRSMMPGFVQRLWPASK
jgi:O-antigen/teichoic acid export membrane protein